ncbi:MAG: hypothetical protein RBG13Loki_2501 [Promethearchaeota archaeon CR_4]|nr:MAG: hypothetical protein RBG13Loki_2501 [Candidatus Lokiarchaeota archaeon CR_4]
MPQERFRFKCLRCGRCCRDPNTIVTLSISDILAIANHLHLGVDEVLSVLGFYHFSENVPKSQIEKMVTRPVLTEKGSAFLGLLKGEGGKCVFLNEENACMIYPSRPKICRTFPFTYTLVKRMKGGVDHTVKMGIAQKGLEYCPGLHASGASLVSLQESKKLGVETIQELEHHSRFAEKWNKLVQTGRKKATARGLIEFILNEQKGLGV